MSKSDYERLVAEENDAQRLTHEGLTTPQFVAESMSWGQVISGALALIAAVGGAAYWAGGKTMRQNSSSIHQTQAALAPAHGAELSPNDDIDPASAMANRIEYAPALPVDPPADMAPTQRTSVSFMLPIEGATVGATLLVRGMAKGVAEGKQLWLATQRDTSAGIWPKQRVELAADGRFEMQVWDFGENGPFSICLLASDADDTRRFDEWLAAGDRDDEWPALALDRSHTTTLGCQAAKLDKRLTP